MSSPTIITSSFYGTLHALGDCIVRGHFEGNIITQESVIVDKNGYCKGTIDAPAIVIEGRFEGFAHCEVFKILPHASVKANIESHHFILYPKSYFEGKHIMIPLQKDTKSSLRLETEDILL